MSHCVIHRLKLGIKDAFSPNKLFLDLKDMLIFCIGYFVIVERVRDLSAAWRKVRNEYVAFYKEWWNSLSSSCCKGLGQFSS